MTTIQISAAYKPAYIYGGPTMSVAMLCETLSKTDLKLEVLTTTANGKSELPVTQNEPVEIDGVKVTYFKRLTKDHTHFSPALLLNLKQKIKTFSYSNSKKEKIRFKRRSKARSSGCARF